MTNNPLHKNQAGQPSTNGGHFAAKTNDEAQDEVLTAQAPQPATNEFNRLSEEAFSANERLLDAAVVALKEQILIGAPTATTAEFEFDADEDGSRLTFVTAFDADGNAIDLDAIAEGDVLYIGRSFEDGDDVRSRGFIKDATDSCKFQLDLTSADVSVDSVQHEIDSLHESASLLERKLAQAGARGAKAVALEQFPAAASIILTNANDGGGSPCIIVARIYDRDGNVLWAEDSGDDSDVDFINEFTMLLDRDLDALESFTEGQSTDETWKLTI